MSKLLSERLEMLVREHRETMSADVLRSWAHDALVEMAEAAALARRVEVERLTGCLATANANHEQFERQWYLERDRAERLAEALRERVAKWREQAAREKARRCWVTAAQARQCADDIDALLREQEEGNG